MAYELDKDIACSAHDLADSLQHSREYIEFERAKAALVADSVSFDSFMRIREKQMQMYVSSIVGSEDDSLRAGVIEEISAVIDSNPVINEFVNAEYRLHKLIQKVQTIFSDSLDFSLGEALNDDELLN